MLFLVILCSSCQSQDIPTVAEFNKEAADYFVENYQLFDLSPLDDFKKCTLKKIIENDLEELGGPRIAILHDRYLIKEYYDGFLQLHFSFIKEIETGTFYFICLPQLDEFIYDVMANYRQKNDSIYELRSLQWQVRINTDPLLNLLSNDDFQFYSSDIHERFTKFRYASEVLTESLRLLRRNEISASRLQSALQEDLKQEIITDRAYKMAMQLIDDAVRNENKIRTYEFDVAGYLITVYSVDKQRPHVAVDMFFIPKNERKLISRSEGIKYRDCLPNKRVNR